MGDDEMPCHTSDITLARRLRLHLDVLENTHNLDVGLGAPLDFSRSEPHASHKFCGTALDETRKFQTIELE